MNRLVKKQERKKRAAKENSNRKTQIKTRDPLLLKTATIWKEDVRTPKALSTFKTYRSFTQTKSTAIYPYEKINTPSFIATK